MTLPLDDIKTYRRNDARYLALNVLTGCTSPTECCRQTGLDAGRTASTARSTKSGKCHFARILQKQKRQTRGEIFMLKT